MEYGCHEKHDSRLARPRGTPLHAALPQTALPKGWRAAGHPTVPKGVRDAKEERMLCSGFRIKHFNLYA